MKAADGLGIAVVLGLAATGVATMSPGSVESRTIELSYSLAPTTLDYSWEAANPGAEQAFLGVLEEFFGPHGQPQYPPDSDLAALGVKDGQLAAGRELFRTKCLHCHGPSGGGDGPTAKFLNPPPRNFRLGKIKFTSTPRAEPPTRDDLRRILRNGVAYTAMPSFAAETEEDVDALVSYVQFLMIRGETEDKTAYVLDDEGTFEDAQGEDLRAEIRDFMGEEYTSLAERWAAAPGTVINPPLPRPAPTPESLARGRELYLSARTECSACHGDNGDGLGPNVYDAATKTFKLTDDWGNPVRPADLRRGFYRGGNRPIDLYRRIFEGIKGTPMPGFAASLQPEQIWDVVDYILSLPYDPASRGQAAPAHGGH